jgi:hypothetical protein
MKEMMKKENDSLTGFGYDYMGIECVHRNSQIIDEIKYEEKEHGPYKLLGSKLREETEIIEDVSNFLKSIIHR